MKEYDSDGDELNYYYNNFDPIEMIDYTEFNGDENGNENENNNDCRIM